MQASKIDFKTFGFVEGLRYNKGFKKFVKEIRENNNIPPKGFDMTKYDEFIIKEKYPKIPTKINKNIFLADVKNLLISYNLSSNWLDFFSDYILFNYFGDYLDKRQILTLDLGSRTSTKKLNEEILNDAKIFNLNTVVILLPNFLSQRELTDYLELNFHKIEKIQKKYLDKIRRISNKGGQQKTFKNIIRDKFIYKNKDLNKKELVARVYKNFKQTLDHAYLNKIIREETKKRQRFLLFNQKEKNVGT
ncbi:hypothetical protein COU49_02565 [Candidatus Nomurabacteria bacterium CG10_big_fil_rev_8_21_14_0_10_35_16]|uniref:Uncharacterized protein n=1 Tax=Candidatus Nomurabacteria bacterium CG10_big_fil_rev_8_21_14_0_10_35_16 TaxID=1974731 RepID=A0A2H0TCT9_9BACT|nr:MAG: hypothetical protein COU49_02565 [Candidatus Nomurabacteria bacterium CG10_big_fil_rev_8_21_14_0_10_35_16]